MSTADIDAWINDYCESFLHAEAVLKRFERIGGETLTTAINQLRYAARHYVDFIKADDIDSKHAHIREAIAHCKRSEYDSVEASICAVGKNIIDFDNDYSQAAILAVIPKYPEYFAKAISELEILQHAPATREMENADEMLKRYGDVLDSLVAFWADISGKIPIVSRANEELFKKEVVSSRRHITIVLLTLAGIAATILVGILTKFF